MYSFIIIKYYLNTTSTVVCDRSLPLFCCVIGQHGGNILLSWSQHFKALAEGQKSETSAPPSASREPETLTFE